MLVSAKPELTEIQLVPLLVDRKTPPKRVPAKRSVSETASASTKGFAKPESTAVQLVPSLVERKTPPPYAATKTSIPDRKSTRLNSSHLGISYAVFCLK